MTKKYFIQHQEIEQNSILIGCLPGQMAHFLRPWSVANELSKKGISTYILGDSDGFHQFTNEQLENSTSENVSYVSLKELIFEPRKIIEGDIPNDYIENVLNLTHILMNLKPKLIISDHNVPLNIATRLANVPLITLTNLSNTILNDEQFKKYIIDEEIEISNSKYFDKLLPNLDKWYNATKEKLNINQNHDYQNFELMESGTLKTYVADDADFIAQALDNKDNLPNIINKGYEFIGSVQASDFIEKLIDPNAGKVLEAKIIELKNQGKKTALCTYGTYWKPFFYEKLLEVVMLTPEIHFFITTKKLELYNGDIPSNLTAIPYINLDKMVKHFDVLSCQGGSGTIYPMLKYSTAKILVLSQNYDHLVTSKALEKHGYGYHLNRNDSSAEDISKALQELANSNRDIDNTVRKNVCLNGAKKIADHIVQNYL